MSYEFKSEEVIKALKEIGINVKNANLSSNVGKTVEYLITHSDACVVYELIAQLQDTILETRNNKAILEQAINECNAELDKARKLAKETRDTLEVIKDCVANPDLKSERANDALSLFHAMSVISAGGNNIKYLSDEKFNSIGYMVYAFLAGEDPENKPLKNKPSETKGGIDEDF